MKLFDFVLARNGVVELTAIDQPSAEFDSFGEVFERGAQAGGGASPRRSTTSTSWLQVARRSPR